MWYKLDNYIIIITYTNNSGVQWAAVHPMKYSKGDVM